MMVAVNRRLQVEQMITHKFPFSDAERAYDMVVIVQY